jgi:DNA-binding MarR family transcriptional regulator
MARTSKARQELHERMTTVFRTYQRAVDTLDELASGLIGVNRTDARVLDLLEQNGRMTAGEIATGAALTSGAVTGVVDRLEKAGYAVRVRDEDDRRKVLVEPTEELRRRAQEIYYEMGPEGERLMRSYSDDELRLVLRFLEEVTELTEEHAAKLRGRET